MVVEGPSERSLESLLSAAPAVVGVFESSSFADPVECCSATGRPFLLDGLGRPGTVHWCRFDRVVRLQLSRYTYRSRIIWCSVSVVDLLDVLVLGLVDMSELSLGA
jgi:hypothetical protein